MSWLNLGAAWWLLVIPALIALYLFRPKPLRVRVSSLRLWRSLPQVERPKARLRRPPKSLLLLLQLLLLGAGAVALMQPVVTMPQGKHTIVILDASGSMQAMDGSATRFERAKAEAGRIAAGLGVEDRATLLRAGAGVSTLCSACDRAAFERALSEAQPGAARTDLRPALDVAAGLASRATNAWVETALVSDGAFGEVGGTLPPNLRFVRVGSPAPNLAITVLSARQPPDGSPGYVAYARVENASDAETPIEVSALADTVPQPTRNLTLPPRGHADLVYQLSAGTVRFTLSLGGGDALATDDQAVIILPGAGQHTASITSQQPELYQRVLSGIPGLQPKTGEASEGAAFHVIEGSLPQTLPTGGLLLIIPEGELFETEGTVENVRPLVIDSGGHSSPLLGGVDLGVLLVREAQQLRAPSWLEPIVTSSDGTTPLLLVGERDGRRVAVLTFDPRNSNLPKLAAFPLLVANLVDWLYPLASAQALRPGDSIHLAPGSTVATPDGRAVRVGDNGIFSDTEQAGLYRVAGAGVAATNSEALTFAVNMADEEESTTPPAPHTELVRPGVATTQTTANIALEGSIPLYPHLATLALALLCAEWLFYSWRRGRA